MKKIRSPHIRIKPQSFINELDIKKDTINRGDSVICIDVTGTFLKETEIYTVEKINVEEGLLFLVGRFIAFSISRFKKFKLKNKESLSKDQKAKIDKIVDRIDNEY